jgi:N-acetylmuramoyl-L-alanine amidase
MTARMRMAIKLILVLLLMLPAVASPAGKGLTVRGVRYFSYAAFTRIVFEIDSAAPYVLTKSEDGRSFLLTAYDGPFALKAPLPAIQDGVVGGLEREEDAGRTVVIIRLGAAAGEVKDFVLRGPDRIVVDVMKGASPAALPQPGKAPVVVLDAGHGGGDTGVVTAQGEEKTITLELALAIKKVLQKDPGLKVVLTREKDRTLSLSDRAAAANAAGASVFVSIHAAAGAKGRVYIQDPDEIMGPREAHPARTDFLGFEAGSEQRETLWGRQQAAHVHESGVLGRQLARQLEGNESAEPIQAPLAGLKAVDAAAVMIEAGAAGDRARVADAAAKGILQYVRENR